MNDHEDDLSELLRGALHREAEQIEAAPGDFQRLRQRIADDGGRRAAAWLPWLAGAAAVACVAGGTGVWLAQRQPAPSADRTAVVAGPATESPRVVRTSGSLPSTSQPSTASKPDRTASELRAEPEPTVAVTSGTHALPVYWVAAGDRPGYKLFKEYYTVPEVGAQQAVEAMLTRRPADPDYTSPWRAAPVQVTVRDDRIVVDVGSAAFADDSVTPELAQAGLQQLVYTATAGLAVQTGRTVVLPVQVLVDGRTGATVWGSLTLGAPVRRDQEAQADVWITSPVEGARLTEGRTAIDVYGTAFEATVLWEVYRVEGAQEQLVDKNYVMVGSNGERGAGRFTVKLAPGTYRIRAYSPEMSDGEAAVNPDVAPEQTGDDKTVVVR